MGLSTAERNRRKRERKKKEREEQRRQEQVEAKEESTTAAVASLPKSEDDVEIEYVAEPVLPPSAAGGLPEGLPPDMNGQQPESMAAVLRRFHQRAALTAVVISDDERGADNGSSSGGKPPDKYSSSDEEDDEDEKKPMSKRKLRELTRPTVAELKRRVKRPDLVEAHDITAEYPDFLIHLKSIPGTVPVPRHWGRKRKYLQGKRGFEKPPFQLPDFIVKTGITEIRDTVAEDEAKLSAKQKNRGRVAPKMGAMDVDYKTLHEAFFKHQTKPTDLTRFGDLYYEGKEMETSTDRKPGNFSKELREALGMLSETSPPPWLINMQRYGSPPSYPDLAIPGLNAPLPNDQCQYGYHAGGWGKPPMDAYGRPLYGGNPFGPPGSGKQDQNASTGLVTSDGKTIAKSVWGGLPTAEFIAGGADDSDVDESSSEEESSDEDMEGSDVEQEGGADGIESVLPPPTTKVSTAPGDLRKQQAGDETPLVDAPPTKQLYQVLEQTAPSDNQSGAVFSSEVKYMVPGTESKAAAAPEGAESVLSKAMPPSESAKRKRKHDADEDDEDLGKNFKF